MAVQLVNGVNPLGTVSPPGYQRAYGTTTVQVVRQGVLRPGTFAQWEPLHPGTDSAYLGPLFGSPYGETPLVFPQRTDERGLIQVWAPEPVRIEVRVSVYGYPSVKQCIDLQFTEDPGDTALDALAAHAADVGDPHSAAGYITMDEAGGVFLTPDEADELFLTQEEGDQRYAIAALSGISQDAADIRYVNVTGDTVLGRLIVADPVGGGELVLEHPSTGTPITLVYTRSNQNRWSVGVVQGAESGANAGSDYIIGRHADDGTWIDQALTIYRATGDTRLNGTVTITEDLAVAGSVSWGPLGSGTTGFHMAVEGFYITTRRASDIAVLESLDINGNYNAIGSIGAGSGVFSNSPATPSAIRLIAYGGNISMEPQAGYVHPSGNGNVNLGHPGLRWISVYTGAVDSTGNIFSATDVIAGGNLTANGGQVRAGNPQGQWTLLKYNGMDVGPNGENFIIHHTAGWGFQFRMAGTDFLVLENGPDGFYSKVASLVVSFGRSTNRWWKVYCGQVDQSCTETVKEDITFLDPSDVLDDVLATPIARFRYKRGDDPMTKGLEKDPLQLGIIAERTPANLLLTETSASPMSVAAAAIAGVQALQAQITGLREEFAAFKAA